MRKEHSQGLTLQFLEKKYQEEKQILLKQNKRLKQNLEEEIERADLLKIKSDQLQRENQKLNAAIAELHAQVEHLRQNQIEKETNCQLIRQLHDSIDKIKGLTAEKEELVTLIQRIYNQKLGLEKEVQQFRDNQKELQLQMENLADKHAQFKTQSTKQIEELLSIKKGLEEEVQRANQKSTDHRKKTKDLQKKMVELQRRLQMSEQLEEKKFAEQIEALRMERDKLYQKSLELNTKCSLSQSNIAQLQKHIDSLEDQLKSSQKKAQAQSDKNYDLRNKLQKQQKIVQQLQEQVQRLKQQNKQLQNERNTVPKQDFMKQMRKNLTEINQLSHKNLQKIGEGPTLRDYPSQSQLGIFIKQDDGLQKAKLQGQITSLQSQILMYKKQNEMMGDDLRKCKKHIDEKHLQMDKKQQEIRQLKLKLEREIERGKEILALRKQNQNLRGKQTQLMQRAKETAEYETSMSLKLAFYQRKIKENLDNIDRKQSIIEKHKSTVCQLEQRQKHYIQTLKKLNDQVQSLKGYKQQCNRKDSILKEYKAKNQKLKQQKEETSKQIAKLKSDVSKLRSDKQRIETQLQIRQKQLASLKTKHEKLSSEKNEQYYKENTRLKENKNANDHKIKQLKKEKEELCDALSQIRSIIISKVEEYIAKQIPTDRKKGHEYEAAKLLGLKAGDLEEFLNPGANMNRRITVDLQELWLQGNFVQFTNCFVNYVVAQTQRKEIQA